MEKNYSRRQFLVAAGITGAAVTGSALTACSPKEANSASGTPTGGSVSAADISWDHEADIVIVGCGAAGWAATDEATKAGLNVIVLEKNDRVGGDMSLCAGILPGYDTPYTKSAGVTTTADEIWQEYVDRGENPHGLPPQETIEYMFRSCGENIDFLADAGVEWKRLGVQAAYSSYDVFFEATLGDKVGGGAFLEPMINSVEASGAELMLNTRGEQLVTNEEGRVIGIIARQNGSPLNIKAKQAVILTTGGYSGNSKMIAMFAEQWPGIAGCGTKSNIGDGLVMATSLGAVTVRTETGGFILANSEYNTGANVNADCLYSGFIVNPDGNRCINDGASYATNDLVDELKAQFARQSEDYLWLILDSSPDSLEHFETNNATHGTSFITADTLESLATDIGVDSSNLVAAAAEFSSYAGSLVDPVYGERSSGYPIHAVEVGPFHALKLGPSVVMTTGGLKASIDGRVMRAKPVGAEDFVTPADDTEFYEAIPGLFAAGMISEWTCFTGWSCTSCFTLGRSAARAAVQESSWE